MVVEQLGVGTVNSDVFYSEMEVIGINKFPVEGPCIVAMNHANSLVDAAITITASPRNVRLTCKDGLLHKKGVLPTFIRWIESIPIQRRIDHGDAVDNSKSVGILHQELAMGNCVGIFPEGICYYKVCHLISCRTC